MSEHNHSHSPVISTLSRAFIVAIVLNMLFVLVEAGVGMYIHSLALIADAGHNLSDVASLGLSLFAFRLSRTKPTTIFSYGYQKTTILAAMINATVLLIAIGIIGWEAIQHFLAPQPIYGGAVVIVAGIGVVINGMTAYFFHSNKENDLNAKGAYLHLITDALVSVGVIAGGVLIIYTGWFWIDSVISGVIIIVIFFSTWRLLKDSFRLGIDALPPNINRDMVIESALKIKGIRDIHHLHIWAISTTKNALTAHIVIDAQTPMTEIELIKDQLKHTFLDLNIHHSTVEMEIPNKQESGDECRTEENHIQ